MTTVAAPQTTDTGPTRVRRATAFLRYRTAQVGVALVAATVALALLGPLFAPHVPEDLIATPFERPREGTYLGTDFLGRDVLSRVLYGGRSVIGLALAATLLAYVIGIPVGLFAGYSRSLGDGLVMRAMDVLIAFPPLLFVLVVATGAGRSLSALVAAVATIHVPRIAYIVRAATAEVAVRAYVEAAVSRGERTISILRREILPNIVPTLLADFGVRLTASILLIAAINYLGLGLQPPASDWALMISENRDALTIQPWVIAIPAALIACLTIGVNLIGDGIARSLGTSIDRETVAR